jgi:hypothetical protein
MDFVPRILKPRIAKTLYEPFFRVARATARLNGLRIGSSIEFRVGNKTRHLNFSQHECPSERECPQVKLPDNSASRPRMDREAVGFHPLIPSAADAGEPRDVIQRVARITGQSRCIGLWRHVIAACSKR